MGGLEKSQTFNFQAENEKSAKQIFFKMAYFANFYESIFLSFMKAEYNYL